MGTAPVSIAGIARGVIGALTIPKDEIHEALEKALTSDQGLIERCTLYPYVVTVEVSNAAGHIEVVSRVQMLRDRSYADINALIPFCAELISSSVYPVEELHGLPVTQRGNFSAPYRAYVEWRQLRSGRKAIDPIRADEDVQSWLRPGRHVGD